MSGVHAPLGHVLTAGVDEAGRGCLAGPVVAAAVILPAAHDVPGLTDSKKIRAEARERMALAIREQALCWSLGLAWPREIERVNILRASLLAMARAVRTLKVSPEALIIDGPHRIPLDLPQQARIKADATVPAVSAASILAKTFRDKLLTALDRRHPGYGFAIHKGYPTARHLEALRRHGPTPVHRRTFKGVTPGRGVGQEGLPKHRSGQLPEQLWLPGI
ncbi:MAG: ribonuclease HII [Desulfovibrionales bacterium]|nr:MAG: ribonuclease HII [Desulfovibrionales bacterium]